MIRRLFLSLSKMVGPILANVLAVAGICIFLAPVILIWFEYGAANVWTYVMMPLEVIVLAGVSISVLALLVGTVIKGARLFASILLYVSATLGFGLLWVWCLILLRTIGRIPVLVGLFFYGFGVIPVALLAALWHKAWNFAGAIVGGILILLAAKAFAAFIMVWATRSQQDSGDS